MEIREPGQGEIRVKNKAIGLNFIDVYYRKGVYKASTMPFTPGLTLTLSDHSLTAVIIQQQWVDWLICEEKNFLILRESTNGECLKIRILVYGLFRIDSPSVFARVFDSMKVYMHLHLFSFIPANVGL